MAVEIILQPATANLDNNTLYQLAKDISVEFKDVKVRSPSHQVYNNLTVIQDSSCELVNPATMFRPLILPFSSTLPFSCLHLTNGARDHSLF
jgi:hypothetical protein